MTRILLVEDNELNRDMLSRRLERRGFTILIAVDGQEGIDIATEQKPDIILMDMNLPVIDGWEATKAIIKLTPFFSTLFQPSSNWMMLLVAWFAMVGIALTALLQ